MGAVDFVAGIVTPHRDEIAAGKDRLMPWLRAVFAAARRPV